MRTKGKTVCEGAQRWGKSGVAQGGKSEQGEGGERDVPREENPRAGVGREVATYVGGKKPRHCTNKGQSVCQGRANRREGSRRAFATQGDDACGTLLAPKTTSISLYLSFFVVSFLFFFPLFVSFFFFLFTCHRNMAGWSDLTGRGVTALGGCGVMRVGRVSFWMWVRCVRGLRDARGDQSEGGRGCGAWWVLPWEKKRTTEQW
jgi:hypothetical protein